MRCSSCGRELDAMRQLLAQYDPSIGNVCIECYNNHLIQKSEELKNKIKEFTSSQKCDTLVSKENKNENKEEEKENLL